MGFPSLAADYIEHSLSITSICDYDGTGKFSDVKKPVICLFLLTLLVG